MKKKNVKNNDDKRFNIPVKIIFFFFVIVY